MLTRRRFLGNSALTSSMLAVPEWARSAFSQERLASSNPIRLAVLGSTYRLGSHLQTITDRFLIGYPFDGDWHLPNIKIVSLYVDEHARQLEAGPGEFVLSMTGAPRSRSANPWPAEDLSPARAKQFGFRLCRNIPEALRVGGDRIAVDAVLTIVEQCPPYPYPSNDKDQVLLPRFDFFEQCTQVFETEKHAVPYFNHKQLSFSFAEAHTMVEKADRLKMPLLAGSSLPVTWRLPGVDVPLGARVKEAVMVGVGTLDNNDFDALEAMQSMLERRKGGETGVKAVQMLEGDDVWAAAKAGRWSKDLLSSALSRSDTPMGLSPLDGRCQDLTQDDLLPQLVKDPAAYCIEYTDGTRATMLMLNGAVQDFNISIRLQGQDEAQNEDQNMVSTQFLRPLPPNEAYSACLASKVESLYQTRKAPYPIQRALLVTGMLEACLNSRHRFGQRIETPHLAIQYQPPAESQYIQI
ncbi:hypothetical protein JAO29_19660 [Edaphobacter sp. HDX4]|uniref:hypothetical protein n=1 Tax=Edaphobacter sp. HDX4 TaxID=2794064 RepID=UPI002FE69FD1